MTRIGGIDLGGRWTKRQVVRVLEVVNAICFPFRRYKALDCTTHADSVRWYIITEEQWPMAMRSKSPYLNTDVW